MYLNKNGNTPYYQFNNLRNLKGVLHFSTTRIGGVSAGGCNTLNMDFTDNDTIDNVLQNRERIAAAVGFNANAYTFTNQIHSANIVVVDKSMQGSGNFTKESRIPNADAMVTNENGICLIAKTADCVPILLCDPVKRIIASVHAGWRGTVQQIALKTVECMVNRFCSNPADILAGIGPSIGACCYEVGDEVVDIVNEIFGTTDGFLIEFKNKSKKHLDLWYTNRFLLEKAGLNAQNIEIACLCTSCNNHEFFSWRKDGNTTGRLATGIILV